MRSWRRVGRIVRICCGVVIVGRFGWRLMGVGVVGEGGVVKRVFGFCLGIVVRARGRRYLRYCLRVGFLSRGSERSCCEVREEAVRTRTRTFSGIR